MSPVPSIEMEWAFIRSAPWPAAADSLGLVPAPKAFGQDEHLPGRVRRPGLAGELGQHVEWQVVQDRTIGVEQQVLVDLVAERGPLLHGVVEIPRSDRIADVQ